MYKLLINASAQRDYDKLPQRIMQQLKNRILSLSKNPRPPGCVKLTGEEGYRLRSGDYRILYRISDRTKEIYLYRIKHRRESYR